MPLLIHDLEINSMCSITGPEVKGLPVVAKTIVFPLMERDMEMTSFQTLDFLSRDGMSTGPSAIATMPQPQILLGCDGGVRGFLVSFLLDNLTKIRLRDFIVPVLSV